MADERTYLNVPFAEKDAAKALGARWDATTKKWYVPAGKDLALFAKWQSTSVSIEATANPTYRATPPAAAHNVIGGITRPHDKNFVAYDGDQPPWA